MELLKISAPFLGAYKIITLIVLSMYVIAFFRSSPLEKQFETNIFRTIRVLFKEIGIYALVIFFVVVSRGGIREYSFWYLYFIFLLTTAMILTQIEYPTSKIQLTINKYFIKIFKISKFTARIPDKIKYYQFILLILHLVLIFVFLTFALKTMAFKVSDTFHLNSINLLDFSLKIYKSNPPFFYAFIVMATIIYLTVRLYLQPAFKMLGKFYAQNYKINVKLSGEVFSNVNIKNTTSKNTIHFMIKDEEKNEIREYLVEKSKIEFIEIVSEKIQKRTKKK